MGENGFCAANQSAQDLLTEFQQTGKEAPFAEIARRYAGMVYNVALRVTHDAHDAEDATQATFLTLAVHAKTSGKIRFLGPWLKKVSHRLALDIRRSKKRRTAREQRHASGNGEANGNGNGNGHDLSVSSGLHTEELRHILREEIDRLPAKYRMPLILYYFGGLTPDEIGEQLHCNTSTLGVRLHRGRKMLAETLSARGISINAAIIAAVLTGLVDSFVKDNVVHAATSAAMQVSASGYVPATAASSHVLHLMQIATSALKWARLKAVVAVSVLMISTFAAGREAIRHIDLRDTSFLRQLNPMRLIQPLLDRILSRPTFSIKTDQSTPGLVGINEVRVAADMPPAYTGSSDLNFTVAASSAPRAGEISFAVRPNTQRPAAPASQLPAVAPSQPVPTLAASSVLAPIYQIPTVSAYRAQPVSAPLRITSSAGISASSSPTPAFVMPPPNQTIVIDPKTGNVQLAGLAVSSFTLPNTTTRATKVVIGDVSAARLMQDSGTLHVSQQLVVGNRAGSNGTYQISKSARVDSPNIVVGNAGNGTLNQDGGVVNATTPDHTGQVVLGAQPTGSGTYNLNSGTLFADTVVVGQQGEGHVNQTGGTAVVTVVKLGAEAGSSGSWSASPLSPILTSFPMNPATAVAMTDLSQSPASPLVPVIVVGGSGSGDFVLHPSPDNSATVIQENPDATGSSLIIRSNVSGNGTFRGSGTVQMTGPLVQNGRMIALGNGSRQTLDLSAASKVSNTIENAPNSGTNGWYSQDRGVLALPRITIAGSKKYTWGEDTLDDTIDLVNSVRFLPHSSSVDGPNGDADLLLFDPNDSDIPALPGGEHAVGLWGFNTTADMSSVDLIVRYDDQLAAALDIDPADLGLWAYQDGWVHVDGSTDLAQDLISGTVNGSFNYFAVAGLPLDAQQVILDSATQPAVGPASLGAVAAPEPGTALLNAAALGTLLSLRRRRQD